MESTVKLMSLEGRDYPTLGRTLEAGEIIELDADPFIAGLYPLDPNGRIIEPKPQPPVEDTDEQAAPVEQQQTPLDPRADQAPLFEIGQIVTDIVANRAAQVVEQEWHEGDGGPEDVPTWIYRLHQPEGEDVVWHPEVNLTGDTSTGTGDPGTGGTPGEGK